MFDENGYTEMNKENVSCENSLSNIAQMDYQGNRTENETNEQNEKPMDNGKKSSDIAHMELKDAVSSESWERKTVKRKKEKKEKSAIFKSAVNGVVFGLCASLVICIVLVIGNKTFLKDTKDASDSSNVEESWIENTQTAQEDVSETETDEKTEKGEESPSFEQTTQTSKNMHNLDVEQIAQNCMPSVVSITTVGVEEVRSMFGTQKYKSQGAGSGIIIGQNDTELLVATNNHVISNAEEVSVCFDDESEDAVISAKVKGTDPSNDLAIVAVAKADLTDDITASIRVATIGDSTALHIGQQVVAIGNALGYGQSVTTGIVSALDRTVDIENFTVKLIQTDAAINPGNSGGALLNMNGELIGINSAKFASEEVEGMGYAIPIATAQPILDNLMKRETREPVDASEAGFLGVSVQDVSDEAAKLYEIPKGAYVGDVEEGLGADKAGIKKGDIIIKFDGLTISDSASLRSNISYYKAGETVEVVYMRSNNGVYEEQTVNVTLAKSKSIDAQNQQKSSDENEDEAKDDEETLVPDQGQEQFEEFFRDFFGDGNMKRFFE